MSETHQNPEPTESKSVPRKGNDDHKADLLDERKGKVRNPFTGEWVEKRKRGWP